MPPGGKVGPGGVILDANGNPVLGEDGKPLVAGTGLPGIDPEQAAKEAEEARERIAALKNKDPLSDEEKAELQRLEGKLEMLDNAAASGKKRKKATKSGMDQEAAQKEADETRRRVADLKKRKANGELSAEELAELERLEGRLAVLDEVCDARAAMHLDSIAHGSPTHMARPQMW